MHQLSEQLPPHPPTYHHHRPPPTHTHTSPPNLRPPPPAQCAQVRTRMFVADLARDSPAISKAHGEVFGTIRPASTMVEVAKLYSHVGTAQNVLIVSTHTLPPAVPILRWPANTLMQHHALALASRSQDVAAPAAMATAGAGHYRGGRYCRCGVLMEAGGAPHLRCCLCWSCCRPGCQQRLRRDNQLGPAAGWGEAKTCLAPVHIVRTSRFSWCGCLTEHDCGWAVRWSAV